MAEVTGNVDAGNVGLHVLVAEEIAKLIVLDVFAKDIAVGLEADEGKHGAHIEVALLTALDVADVDAAHPLIAGDVVHHGVEDELHLRILLGGGHSYRLRAELVATVNEVHLAGIPGKESALLDGAVTTTDHRHGLVLEEGAIADGTITDSPASQLRLAGYAQLFGLATRGHNDRG